MEATSTPPPVHAGGVRAGPQPGPPSAGSSTPTRRPWAAPHWSTTFDGIVRLHRATEAAYLQLLGAVDERKVATDVGAKSTAEWLRLRHRQAGSGRDVAAARATAPGGDLYELGQALADGRVSREHLDVAVRTLGRIPAHLKDEQRSKVAQFLTEQSEQFAPRDFEDVAKALLAVLDPDGAHSFDPDAHQRRSLSMAHDATGMTAGRFLLDQIGSAWFSTALQHYAAPDPAACGVDEHGQPTLPVKDPRSAAQRLADALVLMAKAALANAGERGGEPPRIVIHTTPDQLANTTGDSAQESNAADGDTPDEAATDEAGDDAPGPAEQSAGSNPGATATPGERDDAPGTDDTPADQTAGTGSPLRRPSGAAGLGRCEQTGPLSPLALGVLSCDAILERATVGPFGQILDYGRARRLATPAQRRALAARDGGCLIPGCGALPGWCDAHHLIPWQLGGPTALSNLLLLCPRHHTEVHAGMWVIVLRDHLPWVIPPIWLDPQQRPIRNQLPDTINRAHQLAQQLRLDLDDTG